jgi:hypothetical protein
VQSRQPAAVRLSPRRVAILREQVPAVARRDPRNRSTPIQGLQCPLLKALRVHDRVAQLQNFVVSTQRVC